jgi:hypothetical protein
MGHCRYVYTVDRDTIVVYHLPLRWELISQSAWIPHLLKLAIYMNHSFMIIPTLLIGSPPGKCPVGVSRKQGESQGCEAKTDCRKA